MTSETLLLIGRSTTHAREVFETHADRLIRRAVVDEVQTATYESEPGRELRERLEAIDADRVYVVPMCTAHTYDTTEALPAALSYITGDVRYCEPLGRSPAVTDIITRRATDLAPEDENVSLVLVSFGSSSKPYHRQMAEYHATRLRAQGRYEEVTTCYLLQNPAVECARYNISNDHAVAVPLFLTRSEATEVKIPEKLELTRGGIEYATPFGDHPRITDAIHAEVEKQRVFATNERSSSTTFEAQLARSRPPLATDGEGPAR